MPLTPAFGYKEYIELGVYQLRKLLHQRGLHPLKRRASMVALLKKEDEDKPFPFTSLPAEIRNKIYKLTATSNMSNDIGSPLEYIDGFNRAQVPGLFQCSQQCRSEGLAMFYRYQPIYFEHDFERHPLSLEAILTWLENAGPLLCKGILNMKIIGERHSTDMRVMKMIHSMLSDEATLIYECDANDSSALREIHAKFCMPTSKQAPDYNLRFQNDMSQRVYKLIFKPGMSWFGQDPYAIKLRSQTKREALGKRTFDMMQRSH